MPETATKKAPVRRSSENLTAFDRDLIKASIAKVEVALWFSLEDYNDGVCLIVTVLQVDRYFVKVKPEGKAVPIWVAKNRLAVVMTDV